MSRHAQQADLLESFRNDGRAARWRTFARSSRSGPELPGS